MALVFEADAAIRSALSSSFRKTGTAHVVPRSFAPASGRGLTAPDGHGGSPRGGDDYRRGPAHPRPPGGPEADTQRRAAAPRTATVEDLIAVHHRTSMERLLSGARFITAVVMFVALASGNGLLHTPSASLAMAAYGWYSAGLLAVAWMRPARLLRASPFLHALDLAWATVATAVSGGASSHVFPLFTFVLVAAAYRWGLWRTVRDSALIVAIALAQSVPAFAGLTPWPFEFDWLVLWACDTLVLAVLFGALAERQHALTLHAAAVGRVIARATGARGLDAAIHAALVETIRLFGARRAVLVFEDADRRRLFRWSAAADRAGKLAVEHGELTPDERRDWLFPLPPDVCALEARRPGPNTHPVPVGLDGIGRVENLPVAIPCVLTSMPGETWLGATIGAPGGWVGRLYLADPGIAGGTAMRLALLHSLVAHVGPALLELYMLNGLRTRAEARERARVSRELHDGVIQALAGLQMRLEVLRRTAEREAPSLAPDLTSIRDRLHQESMNVRELMERLRPVDLDARRLPSALRELVDRFGRETGIESRVRWTVPALEITPHGAREIYRIVQEALVNVRRHSGAAAVLVSADAIPGGWMLRIDDDGRGLGFTGRLSDARLAAAGKGPRVIRERVAALGGAFAVESCDTGTRLEITLPCPLEA